MDSRLESAGTQLEAALHRYLEASFATPKSGEAHATNDSLQGFALLDRIPQLAILEQRIQSLKAITGVLRNCSHVVVAIHQLPSSLLARIFRMVVSLETCVLKHEGKAKLPRTQIYLTHVCTHWRRIAIDLPGIWTHIDISPSILRSKDLLSRLQTFLSRSGESNLNLHVEYADEDEGEEASSLNNFIAPLVSRIQGVACRIKLSWSVSEQRFSPSALFCFLNENTVPGRLTTLEVSVKDTSFAFFLQTSEQKPDTHTLSLNMTTHHLEELLLPITVLRLNGLYPRWTSKAYRGLVELRLYTPNRFFTIPESDLVAILSHSPQLRVFELEIQIEFAETPSAPVKLLNLEALITHIPSYPQLGRFLRLIDTGSSPLFVSVDSAHGDDELDDNLVHFFTHSNITGLSTVRFFSISKALELVNLAHTIKKFAMKHPPFDPMWADESNQPIQVRLDALYLLGSMRLDINQLQSMVDWSGVQKLVQSRNQDATSEQDEIKRQIAALQARLLPSPKQVAAQPAEEPTGPTGRVLVARSPSPKRRKLQPEPQTKSQTKQNSKTAGAGSKAIAAPVFKPPSPPRKSAVAAAASAFQTNRAARLKEEKEPTVRSTSFAQQLPAERPAPTRNDDMTIKEDLPLGPIDHPAPFDDPRWERREPYSGIHLSSRKLPFDEFQDFMYGRVYVSPSKLYSVVRLSPDRSAYDVPIEGDWVTIAVIAERGQVQVSKKGNRGGPQGKKGENSASGQGGQNGNEDDDEDSRPAPREKKYMRLLLVDFGHRVSEGQPTSKEQTKGDALLSMLLFEADSGRAEDGQLTKSKGKGVTYKGGSGGAFEACAKLREGAVLAILNPRILKPFQRTTGNPYPRDNALAITPESAESIAVLGYSRDLGSCRAVKRDGNPCGSWCDKRISDVCEYHIQDAIKSKRAARPEFSAGTADFSNFRNGGGNGKGGKFGKQGYDPSRKWGLAPSIGQQNAAASSESAKLGGGATYVVDGRVFSGFDSGGFDADTTRLKRLKRKKEEEMALEEVIRKDGGKTPAARILKAGAAHLKSVASTGAGSSTNDSPDEQLDTVTEAPKKVYSANLVKSIGFDPSRRAANSGRPKEGEGMRQLVANLDRSVNLGHAPGTKRLRSNVTTHFAPPREKGPEEKEPETQRPEPNSDSDSDLEIEF